MRCSCCNTVVGRDPSVTTIERCNDCCKRKASKRIKTAAESFAHVKKGPAKDLPPPYDQYVLRSGWERNLARVLTKRRVKWEFESEKCTFKFSGYQRKPWGYICDFYLPNKDQYIEVKGYFYSKDRSKIKRLKKHYPQVIEKLTVILSRGNKKAIAFYKKEGINVEYYEDLTEKWKGKIEAWE